MQKVFYDGIRVEYGISMEIPHKKKKLNGFRTSFTQKFHK